MLYYSLTYLFLKAMSCIVWRIILTMYHLHKAHRAKSDLSDLTRSLIDGNNLSVTDASKRRMKKGTRGKAWPGIKFATASDEKLACSYLFYSSCLFIWWVWPVSKCFRKIWILNVVYKCVCISMYRGSNFYTFFKLFIRHVANSSSRWKLFRRSFSVRFHDRTRNRRLARRKKDGSIKIEMTEGRSC